MGILGDGSFTNLSQMRNDIEMQKNQNAFPFLGRTVLEEQQLLAPVRFPKFVLPNCKNNITGVHLLLEESAMNCDSGFFVFLCASRLLG